MSRATAPSQARSLCKKFPSGPIRLSLANAYGSCSAWLLYIYLAMTRNNLPDHLLWLLQDADLAPAHPPHLTPPGPPDSGRGPTTGLGQNSQPTGHSWEAPNPRVDVSNPRVDVSNPRVAVSNPRVDVSSSGPAQAPAPASAAATSHSAAGPLLGNIESAARNGAMARPASSARSKQTEPSLPRYPRTAGLVQSTPLRENEEREVVDLTSDSPPDSSSSISRHPPPEDVRLWRADYASRPEPLHKQGWKRKSNDITKSPAKRQSQDSGIADPFDQDLGENVLSPSRAVHPRRGGMSQTKILEVVRC